MNDDLRMKAELLVTLGAEVRDTVAEISRQVVPTPPLPAVAASPSTVETKSSKPAAPDVSDLMPDARTDIPALLDEVERLQAKIEAVATADDDHMPDIPTETAIDFVTRVERATTAWLAAPPIGTAISETLRAYVRDAMRDALTAAGIPTLIHVLAALRERAELAEQIAQARDDLLGEWLAKVEQAAELERRMIALADELEVEAARYDRTPYPHEAGHVSGILSAAYRIREALGVQANATTGAEKRARSEADDHAPDIPADIPADIPPVIAADGEKRKPSACLPMSYWPPSRDDVTADRLARVITISGPTVAGSLAVAVADGSGTVHIAALAGSLAYRAATVTLLREIQRYLPAAIADDIAQQVWDEIELGECEESFAFWMAEYAAADKDSIITDD